MTFFKKIVNIVTVSIIKIMFSFIIFQILLVDKRRENWSIKHNTWTPGPLQTDWTVWEKASEDNIHNGVDWQRVRSFEWHHNYCRVAQSPTYCWLTIHTTVLRGFNNSLIIIREFNFIVCNIFENYASGS